MNVHVPITYILLNALLYAIHKNREGHLCGTIFAKAQLTIVKNMLKKFSNLLYIIKFTPIQMTN